MTVTCSHKAWVTVKAAGRLLKFQVHKKTRFKKKFTLSSKGYCSNFPDELPWKHFFNNEEGHKSLSTRVIALPHSTFSLQLAMV